MSSIKGAVMTDTRTVECHRHGPQQKAFVCQHIASSLCTGVAVGFHWSADDQCAHPDAWCSLCDDARLRAGGDWTPAIESLLGVTLVCGRCYEAAKKIWALGRAAEKH
jgi:hypothetical protein